MVSSELQPGLCCLKLSSSRNGSACKVSAAAEPVALTDTLHMAPTLLPSLYPLTMAPLLSTSRQLRCMIHEHVSSINIGQYKARGTQYQITELQMLTNGNWPHLQRLKIYYRDYLEIAAITQLSTASWSSLTSLDLSENALGADAISQLVLGKWPALKRLNLGSNRLGTAAMAFLAQADWPLEELILAENDIGREAMENLTHGRWPKLAHLNLMWNELDAHTIAVLTKVQWPLQHLDLAHNKLDASAMTQLGRARRPDLGTPVGTGSGVASAATIGKSCEVAWPQLVSLDLRYSFLRQTEVAGLCTARLPKLSIVDLTGNLLDKVSMMHLIKADWPELKHLDLSDNYLDDVAVEVLSHNRWHKMERLDLVDNDGVTQNAASFLSIEQQRVTVF